MNSFLDACRQVVRAVMRKVARLIHRLTGGKISPNLITVMGFVMHIPIAYILASGYFGYAAILLLIFGLFDSLDGELARLQNRASARGMLLDASTDRMKEVLLYTGAAYALIGSGYPYDGVWAVTACGASLCVSYIKAKGETAVKNTSLTPNEINRIFQDGFSRFEVRMAILLFGLLLNQLVLALMVITITATWTAIVRLIKISRKI